MATIQKLNQKSGIKYRVLIRKAGLKPITKTFKTKRLAVAYAQRVEGDRELSDALGSNQATIQLSTIIAEFLAQYTKKDTSIHQRLNWWNDHYGQLSIIDIDPALIKKGLRALASQGLTGATQNRYRIALSCLFNFAVEEHDLQKNPCHAVKGKPESKGIVRALSVDERKRLLVAARSSHWGKMYLAVLISITTGARKSETMGLRWCDINFNSQVASLHDTKNGKPRQLPLTNEVIVELQKFREVGNGLIFPSVIVPDKPFEFRKAWNKVLKQASIAEFRWHDLRHSCATMLAESGATLLQIGEVLGHSGTEVTKRYAHLCIEHKQTLINDTLGNIGVG